MIKVIETIYKGYRFRSRLEARWAVFFDQVHQKWEYEKEGFDLGNGLWYLPDFYIPEFDLWFEIKPDEDAIEDDKAELFSKTKRLCIGIGLPFENLEFYGPESDEEKFIGEIYAKPNSALSKMMIANGEMLPINKLPPELRNACLFARQARFEHGKATKNISLHSQRNSNHSTRR